MRKPIYTAAASVRGGREGHGQSADGSLDVNLRMPKEMGGEGGGTNPEQLFAVGYAACFDGAIGVAARRQRIEVGEVQIDSRVALVPSADRSFALSVELDVNLPEVLDSEQACQLVRAAHQTCPYSMATRGNIEVKLTANGQPVS